MNVCIQLTKVTDRVHHEYMMREKDEAERELFAPEDIKYIHHFAVYGKLDLQSDINSLVVLHRGILTLWLYNIKDNQICSVIQLSCSDIFHKPSISVDNSVVTMTVLRKDYFFSEYFGNLFYRNKKLFTRYKIDENGYFEFVRD